MYDTWGTLILVILWCFGILLEIRDLLELLLSVVKNAHSARGVYDDFWHIIFFQWQTVHLDFPNAAKKQSRPADTGAHENPHTAVKNKESLGHTPRQQSGHHSVWSIVCVGI